MDLWTATGTACAVILISSIMVIEALHSGGFEALRIFLNLPAFLLCIIGPFVGLMISNSFRDFKSLIGILKTLFFTSAPSPKPLIGQLVKFAEVARRDGILALEGVVAEIKDPFLVKGVQLAVDGTDPELIDQILNTELEYLEERHKIGKKMLDTMSLLSPSMGLVGCVMGLILMLMDLDDPAKTASRMAVAMVATFYGVALANLIYIPMANKLNRKHLEEKLLKEVVIRGVMAIQSGDNPRIVEQKLKIFLPPKER